MMALLWLRRLLGTHLWRMLGAAAGVGLAVALLGSLGAFLAASFGTMTERAIAGVPVDWQVQVVQGGDLRTVRIALASATRVAESEIVNYADVAGLSANSGGTVQTTGPGQVVGIAASYRRAFPDVMRALVGSTGGVLLAQQTASNLHAHVGDRIDILVSPKLAATGRSQKSAIVDGIVDLPSADSFFQAIGVPGVRAPKAPPDNVVIVPAAMWERWFAAQRTQHPSTVRTQIHVRLSRALPHDPLEALTAVIDAANRVELSAGGAAIVGDNLAAQLQSTREDALYARLLFLFLGLPGVALAAIIAVVVIASGAERRRRDAALLRVRGATVRDVLLLTGVEAATVWIVASLFAAIVTVIAVQFWGAGASAGLQAAALWSAIGAVILALVVAMAHLVPLTSSSTVSTDLKTIGRTSVPLWRKTYLDVVLIAVGIAFFLKTAAGGYQVVLAPEGVLQSAVSYDALVGPLLLWLGGGLLIRRLAESLLARRALLERYFKPLAGNLAGPVAASTSRQRTIVGRGLTIVALAIAFAVSTSVFNDTYNAQSRVDAELSNGADVAVALPNNAQGDAAARRLAALNGVAGVDILQHRFTYVGQDLQDLYAIDPAAIGKATDMSDAFFGNHDARATLARLAAAQDGVLVAEETVKDFQLHDGDRLNLRLQAGSSGKYRAVPFTFVGVVREFPTAPHDSFLVANASYVSRATGNAGSRVVLLRADSRGPGALAAAARSTVDGLPGARVTDIASVQKTIGSSLTAVDLHGLTLVELIFAMLLLVGASGLSLALGFAERRRNFAILAALGATPRQLGSFLWAEAIVAVAGGTIAGAALGFLVAQVLVKVLTGVFDPPPDVLAVPWIYLGAAVAITTAATILVVLWTRAASMAVEVPRPDRP